MNNYKKIMDTTGEQNLLKSQILLAIIKTVKKKDTKQQYNDMVPMRLKLF